LAKGSFENRGSFKNRIWEILEHPAADDRLSRLFDFSMIALILVSVAEVALRTVPSMTADQRQILWAIEVCALCVFTVEFLLRLWVADLGLRSGTGSERLAYVRSAEGVVDLLAVLPVYLELFFPERVPMLAGLLLLRIFKLVRYSPALATLVTVVVQERKALLGAVTIMLVLLLFSSTTIYLVEREDQPEAFGSIPAAMWWGIATLTTVGYGDVTPITPIGKLFGGIVTLLGVGMFALPAGILSSGFTREMKQRRFLRTASLVASVPLFEGLNASDIAQISRLLEPLVVKAGQIVVRQGDEATSMFFVADGALEVDVQGHRKRLSTEFFGEIALLEGGMRSATIRSLSRCQLLELQSDQFEELLSASPRIERAVRSVAGKRLERDARRVGIPVQNGDDSTY
jgi:voltage-gated potassium channel